MADLRQSTSGALLYDAAIDILAARLQGEVIRPGDASYDRARQVWNGMIDRRPALIARCGNVEDVQATVAFARDQNLPVAIRGGGHSVAGYGVCDAGVVIDLSLMTRIDVDPAQRRAQAQARPGPSSITPPSGTGWPLREGLSPPPVSPV